MKKKIVALFIILLCFCGCYTNTSTGETVEVNYIVEEKYMSWNGWYSLVISDLDTKSTKTIRVGEYTYETTNPGDTLTLKLQY